MDGKAKNWYDEGAVPSEPYFVARPGAVEEDDGKFVVIDLPLYSPIHTIMLQLSSKRHHKQHFYLHKIKIFTNSVH